jgi:Protein phosphatase 2C
MGRYRNRMTAPRVVGAATVGPAHTAVGEGCQDRFAHRVTGSGAVVVTVADGLGSAAKAAYGASVAVDAAVAEAAAMLEATPPAALAEAVVAAVVAARAALEAAVVLDGQPLASLACTLIVAAGDQDSLAVAHVGDGAVVVQHKDSTIALASGPGDSEYVDHVDPLTCDRWKDHLRTATVSGTVAGFAVLTDGCQRAALRSGVAHEPHPQFFLPIFEHVRRVPDEEASADLAGLLAGPKLSEHSDDDKTLVLALFEPRPVSLE